MVPVCRVEASTAVCCCCCSTLFCLLSVFALCWANQKLLFFEDDRSIDVDRIVEPKKLFYGQSPIRRQRPMEHQRIEANKHTHCASIGSISGSWILDLLCFYWIYFGYWIYWHVLDLLDLFGSWILDLMDLLCNLLDKRRLCRPTSFHGICSLRDVWYAEGWRI